MNQTLVIAEAGVNHNGDIALALEVDAVSLDSAVGGDPQQESVEFFKVLRHSGDPPLPDPRGFRAGVD